MAENKKEIDPKPLIGIIWFFIGVIMEWFAVMIQKGNEWERIAQQYPDACGAAGIGGWTLVIFFIITLMALVIYLITQLRNLISEPEDNKKFSSNDQTELKP